MAITEQQRREEKMVAELLLLSVGYILGAYFMLHIGIALNSFEAFIFLVDINALLSLTFQNITDTPGRLLGGSLIPFQYFTVAYFMAFVWYISTRKKVMPGKEHGTARWARKSEAKRLKSKVKTNNIILTATESLNLNAQKIRKNLNVMVIGDSGAGKTRFYIKPNLMQMHTSYVVTDPKGEILRDTGKMFENHGYKIKVFNLIEMGHSYCYNPFHYIKKDEDVLKVINCLMKNTTPANSNSNDPFWEKAETALLQALFFFIWYKLPVEEQNFTTVLKLLRMAVVKEEDEEYQSDLDFLFETLKKEKPYNVAILQYELYKKAAGKTAKSIIVSTGVRLAAFNIESVANLVHKDTLELERLCEEKIILFVIIPDSDTTFNFLVAMMYSQMFLMFSEIAFNNKKGKLNNHVRFLLDEFANIGQIPDFDAQASTMRSKNFSVSVVLQHVAQLEKMYKESWKAIMNCCNTKLYLGGDEKETTEYFSSMLGKETIDVQTGNISRGRNKSSTVNYAKQARELMTPDEIGHMPDSDCFVMIRGVHPFYSKKYNIKSHGKYKELYDADEYPNNFFDYREIVTPIMPRQDEEKVREEATKKEQPYMYKENEEIEINLSELEIGVSHLEKLRYAVEFEF